MIATCCLGGVVSPSFVPVLLDFSERTVNRHTTRRHPFGLPVVAVFVFRFDLSSRNENITSYFFLQLVVLYTHA